MNESKPHPADRRASSMLRDHAELSQEMGDENGGEKKGAGDSDERKKEIDRFPQRGKAARPDGEEID
jgi:hypothetical protein